MLSGRSLIKFFNLQQVFIKRSVLSTDNLIHKRTLTLNTGTSNSLFYQKPLVVPQPVRTSQSLNLKICSSLFQATARMSSFVFPKNQPVVQLDCENAFKALNSKEKLYAHYLSQAAWYGGLIVLVQTSPESPVIFQLLHKLYRSQTIASLKDIALQKCSFSEDDFQALLIYSSGFLCNMGNYKGFGDTKFIPDIPKEKLYSLLKESEAFKKEPKIMQDIWDICGGAIYSLDSRQKQLGLGEKGVTTYFSDNCTQDDANKINKFLQQKGIEAYNNRAFKIAKGNGTFEYEVRFASSVSTDSDVKKELIGTHEYEGDIFHLTRGDYSGLLSLVTENLTKAKEHAANENERNMIECYIDSFTSGSLDAHKDGSRFWIKDKGPVIETYIGFIETYRDPVGMRGEFEGFVAMVNKPMSKKFAQLVDNAEQFLPLLPWPSEYEKDKFLKPDFTSLDVLTFAGSGIPAGINIPNYDEIRQNEGFKNVSLGNVIPASYKEFVMPFLSDSDQALMRKHRIGSFEVQVGLHELLGHGSGKLFAIKNGKPNFDASKVVNLLTGQPVSQYYGEGETYDSRFTSLGSAYEECRAECVGLHLCIFPKILEIFGYTGEEAEEVAYVNWLSMVWKGLLSLEMYQPDSQVWLQAHSQARFVILNVLLEAGQGFMELKEVTNASGEPSLLVSMDRTKIKSVGTKAIAEFLMKLQVYKSLGDSDGGRKMFENYSAVNNEGKYPYQTYRNIVLDNKQPRKMFVQANTVIQDEDVVMKTYEASHPSLIQSWVDRFSSTDVDSVLQETWSADKQHFSY